MIVSYVDMRYFFVLFLYLAMNLIQESLCFLACYDKWDYLGLEPYTYSL